MRDAGQPSDSGISDVVAGETRFGVSRRLGLVAIVLLALVMLGSVLAVNTFPAITNDSVVYIEHSLDLFEGGFVVNGFRQVGYPAFLAGVRGFSELVGAEPLLTAAFVQRALLVAAVGLAIWAWRWWAVPLVIFILAPETLAYSNLLLTEALALPVAVLMVFPTVAHLAELRADQHSTQQRRLVISGVLVVCGALLLYSVRFTFAVFGAVPLVLALASWKTTHRRVGVALITGFLALAGVLTLSLTMENRVEVGVASPSVDDGRADYYYAWLHVFREQLENRDDPAMADFYDNGSVYDFERELSADGVPFAERRDLFQAEIGAMLAAADMSQLGSRFESMAWALAGGRLHDIAGGVFGIVHSTRTDIDRWVHLSSYAISNGPLSFADRYNQGRLPQVVITDPIGVPLPVPDGQSLAMLLVPLSIGVMLVGLRFEETRWMALSGLLVVFATAAGMGWIRADNFRFLIVGSAFAIASATSLLPLLAGKWTNREAGAPVAKIGAP